MTAEIILEEQSAAEPVVIKSKNREIVIDPVRLEELAAQGATQYKAAKELGISQSTLSFLLKRKSLAEIWERGQRSAGTFKETSTNSPKPKKATANKNEDDEEFDDYTVPEDSIVEQIKPRVFELIEAGNSRISQLRKHFPDVDSGHVVVALEQLEIDEEIFKIETGPFGEFYPVEKRAEILAEKTAARALTADVLERCASEGLTHDQTAHRLGVSPVFFERIFNERAVLREAWASGEEIFRRSEKHVPSDLPVAIAQTEKTPNPASDQPVVPTPEMFEQAAARGLTKSQVAKEWKLSPVEFAEYAVRQEFKEAWMRGVRAFTRPVMTPRQGTKKMRADKPNRIENEMKSGIEEAKMKNKPWLNRIPAERVEQLALEGNTKPEACAELNITMSEFQSCFANFKWFKDAWNRGAARHVENLEFQERHQETSPANGGKAANSAIKPQTNGFKSEVKPQTNGNGHHPPVDPADFGTVISGDDFFREKILRAIENGTHLKTYIAREISLSPQTCLVLLNELVAEGRLVRKQVDFTVIYLTSEQNAEFAGKDFKIIGSGRVSVLSRPVTAKANPAVSESTAEPVAQKTEKNKKSAKKRRYPPITGEQLEELGAKGWTKTEAAKFLGIPLNTFTRRINRQPDLIAAWQRGAAKAKVDSQYSEQKKRTKKTAVTPELLEQFAFEGLSIAAAAERFKLKKLSLANTYLHSNKYPEHRAAWYRGLERRKKTASAVSELQKLIELEPEENDGFATDGIFEPDHETIELLEQVLKEVAPEIELSSDDGISEDTQIESAAAEPAIETVEPVAEVQAEIVENDAASQAVSLFKPQSDIHAVASPLVVVESRHLARLLDREDETNLLLKKIRLEFEWRDLYGEKSPRSEEVISELDRRTRQ